MPHTRHVYCTTIPMIQSEGSKRITKIGQTFTTQTVNILSNHACFLIFFHSSSFQKLRLFFFPSISLYLAVSSSSSLFGCCWLLLLVLLRLARCSHISAPWIRQSLATNGTTLTWDLRTCSKTIRNNVI